MDNTENQSTSKTNVTTTKMEEAGTEGKSRLTPTHE